MRPMWRRNFATSPCVPRVRRRRAHRLARNLDLRRTRFTRSRLGAPCVRSQKFRRAGLVLDHHVGGGGIAAGTLRARVAVRSAFVVFKALHSGPHGSLRCNRAPRPRHWSSAPNDTGLRRKTNCRRDMRDTAPLLLRRDRSPQRSCRCA